MKEIFRKAKVGDKVWSVAHGYGIVLSIKRGANNYPLRVQFNLYKHTYTYTGKDKICNAFQTLFWQEFEIPKEASIKPLPDIEINTKVLVWDNHDR
jgi:hypothetical protein